MERDCRWTKGEEGRGGASECRMARNGGHKTFGAKK